MDTRDHTPQAAQESATVSPSLSGKLDGGLLDLVRLRLAQIHSHAQGIEFHRVSLLKQNESEERLRELATWTSSHLFSRHERFALALAEMLTDQPDSGVTRSMLGEAPRYFSRPEIIHLVLVIQAVQDWHANEREAVLEIETV